MKRYNAVELRLIVLMFFSVAVTAINILLFGTTNILFLPAANFNVVVLLWLYYAFSSNLLLILGAILYFVHIICLVRIILKKNVRTLAMIVYILDIIGVLYSMIVRPVGGSVVSFVMDLCVMALILKRGKTVL